MLDRSTNKQFHRALAQMERARDLEVAALRTSGLLGFMCHAKGPDWPDRAWDATRDHADATAEFRLALEQTEHTGQ